MGYMTQQILAMVGANVVRWGKDPQLCELSVTHTVLMKAKNSWLFCTLAVFLATPNICSTLPDFFDSVFSKALTK